MTAAPDLVAGLRSDLEKMPPGEREFWSERLAPIFALIESQRATIERVERDRDIARDLIREKLELIEVQLARVTALEAEKAGDHAILRDLVASLNRRGQTLSISHDELSSLEARAAQALSRSSTEEKNDD